MTDKKVDPRVVAIDIETVPCPEAAERFLADPPPFDVGAALRKMKRPELDAVAKECGVDPSLYKNMDELRTQIVRDPVALSDALESAQHIQRHAWEASYYNDAALHAITAKVVTVAAVNLVADRREAIGTEDEKSLLGYTSDLVQGADAIVGFNLNGFDGPMLRNRMLVHGITPPRLLARFPRYRSWPQIDLMAELANWAPRAKGTLGDWCWRLGIEEPPKTDPAQIRDWYDEEDWPALEEHCLADATAAARLYEVLEPLLYCHDLEPPQHRRAGADSSF